MLRQKSAFPAVDPHTVTPCDLTPTLRFDPHPANPALEHSPAAHVAFRAANGLCRAMTVTMQIRALTPTFAFDPHQVGSGAVCTADPGDVDGLKTPNSHRVLEQRMQNWVPRKSGTERAETGQVISHNYADYRPPAVLSTPSTPSAAD